MLAAFTVLAHTVLLGQAQPTRSAGEGVPPGLVATAGVHYKPMVEYAVCNGLVTFVQEAREGGNEVLFVHQDFDDSGLDPKAANYGLKTGPASLRVFNLATKNIRVLKVFGPKDEIYTVDPGKDGCPGVVTVSESDRNSLYFLNARADTLKRAAVSPASLGVAPVFLTDSKLTAVVLTVRRGGAEVGLFDQDGNLQKRVNVSREVLWGFDETVGDVVLYLETVDGKGVPRAFDLVKGANVDIPAARPHPDGYPIVAWSGYSGNIFDLAVRLPSRVTLRGRGSDGSGEDGGTVDLATGHWQVLPSRRGDYVCLFGPAGLRIVPVKRLTDAEVEAVREEWVKDDAMTRGKTIGTALQIYLATHGDKFPNAGTFYDDILPFVRNAGLLRDFTYSLNGHDLNDLRITGDSCGFIETNYGRAIVMVDSSVKWIPRGGKQGG